MRLATLSTIVGLALAVPAFAGMTWTGYHVRQEISANTNWRLIQTWERLETIRKQRKLSQVEWASWCQAGKDLNIFKDCPKR